MKGNLLRRQVVTALSLLTVASGEGLAQLTSAKTFGVIVGVAEEGTGAALSGAVIRLDSLQPVVSDAVGFAAFRRVGEGKHLLRVTRIGYTPMQQMLSVGRTDSVEVICFLRRNAVELDTATVVAAAENPLMTPAAAEFYRRRGLGVGRYLTREELGSLSRGGVRVADVIARRFPGVDAKWSSSGTVVALTSKRGPSSLQHAACTIPVYIDGMRAEGNDVASVRATEIGGIEFYSTSPPPEFAVLGNTCGVILIWRAP
jgi:hypothetical protein